MSAAEVVAARARSPTASAESDSEDSSDSEVELADPKESLRWLGYAHRVCADAAPRRAPFRRRRVVARPRRAVPTDGEKHATAKRASVVFQPQTSAHAPLPAPRSTARAGSSLSLPVADRSATADSRGCVPLERPPRARVRAPSRPRRAKKENPRFRREERREEKKTSSSRARGATDA